jgi:hypothetical protein
MGRRSMKVSTVLKEELGQALGSKELSSYIGLDEATVRKYYMSLGGIRIGTKYLFFEKEVLNAIQKRTKVDWSDTEEWQEKDTETISDQAGGLELGGGAEKKARIRLEDPYGIFPGGVGQ